MSIKPGSIASVSDLALLDRLDHGSFRAFLAAVKTLNFTSAAERAGMTQSGVSQHIRKLETQLDTQLFQRVNKKVHLTKAGEILLDFVESHRERTSTLFDKIQGEVGHLSGRVRYAMPHSCLFTPHFEMLLEKRRRWPGIELDVRLCPNEEIFELLLGQKIDFGFVTEKTNNPAVKHEFFAAEEYILVNNDKNQFKEVSRENIAGLKFVSYPGMGILFDLWAQNQFGTKRLSHETLNIAGQINSLSGAITMVEHGVGLTVLPKHCVAGQLKSKSLFECTSGKRGAQNEIYIATIASNEMSRRVQATLNAFWEMKS